ncbi:hypothetical protein GGI25_002830 [Coemansia spiralis]|uniref:Uncharacterized protein n=1 Tax=Coemansia spiralis TaxID=417178 RepID=A0A9W8KZ02_9FUNG|nr:hypothetical protein GGI25_002830 [Coemansia spiralis]
MEYEHHDVRLPLPNVAAENDRMVDLSNRCLSALLPDIGLCAAHMTRVDLSNNALKELPYEIGHLRQLQWINVSNNSLELLPPTIAFWQHLHTMNASGNHLTDIPTAVRHLDKLAVLNLANNRLTCVPAGLWKLRSLCLLDLSYNQIDVLPARIFLQGGVAAPNRGTLESILLDGCPLVNKLVPSLVDIILHRMIENNDVYPYDLPEHIQQRLNSFVACDYCHKMYPANTGAKRLAFITRDRMELPIEYSLCRAHWDNEKTRIALLFAPRKPEYAQQYEKPRKAALLQIKSNLLGYNDGIDPNFHAATSTKPPERLSLGRRMLNTLARKKSHANGAANRMSLPEKTKPKAHLAQHIDDAEITTGVGSLWAIWQHFEDDIVAV